MDYWTLCLKETPAKMNTFFRMTIIHYFFKTKNGQICNSICNFENLFSSLENNEVVSRFENQQVLCPSPPYSWIGAWNNCSQVLLTNGSVNVALDQSIEYDPILAGLGI